MVTAPGVNSFTTGPGVLISHAKLPDTAAQARIQTQNAIRNGLMDRLGLRE